LKGRILGAPSGKWQPPTKAETYNPPDQPGTDDPGLDVYSGEQNTRPDAHAGNHQQRGMSAQHPSEDIVNIGGGTDFINLLSEPSIVSNNKNEEDKSEGSSTFSNQFGIESSRNLW